MNDSRITVEAIQPGDLIRYPLRDIEPVSERGHGGEVRLTWSEPREIERVDVLSDYPSAMLWFTDANKYGDRFLLLVGWQLDMLLLAGRAHREDWCVYDNDGRPCAGPMDRATAEATVEYDDRYYAAPVRAA